MNFTLTYEDVNNIERMINAEMDNKWGEIYQKATDLCKDLYEKSITQDELSILNVLYNIKEENHSIKIYVNWEQDDIRFSNRANDKYSLIFDIDTKYPFKASSPLIIERMNNLLSEVSSKDNHIRRLMELNRDVININIESKVNLMTGRKISSLSKEMKEFINKHYIDKMRNDFDLFCNTLHKVCNYPKLTRKLKDVQCTPRINGILFTGISYVIKKNEYNLKPNDLSVIEWIKEVNNKAYPPKIRELIGEDKLNLGSEKYKWSLLITSDESGIRFSNNRDERNYIDVISCIIFDLYNNDYSNRLISDYLNSYLNNELSKNGTVVHDYIDNLKRYRKEVEILRNPEIMKCIEHTSEIPETLASSILYVSEKLPRPDYFKKIVDEIFE